MNNTPKNLLVSSYPLLSAEDGKDVRTKILAMCKSIGTHRFWQGSRTPTGYGRIKINGKLHTTSRVMLCITTNEPLNKKADACHKPRVCDGYRFCCSPDHLEWGTRSENSKQRERTKRRNAERQLECFLLRLVPEGKSRNRKEVLRLLAQLGMVPKNRMSRSRTLRRVGIKVEHSNYVNSSSPESSKEVGATRAHSCNFEIEPGSIRSEGQTQ